MAEFEPVRVVLRDQTDETSWDVEVDPDADIQSLLPDLAGVLELDGDPSNYALTVEGSIREPTLVITARLGRKVGKVTPRKKP
ncbi:hypothetical protein [Citricoccus muralis]|uniref:hypothetical protein n=1 Tax=Citricoccus muralis TaxID=169134 RepID=UPI0011C04A40|nr:hypothetical protein [Citricoccus muralis]